MSFKWKAESQTLTKTLNFTVIIDGENLQKYYTTDLSEIISKGNYLFTPKSITMNSIIYDEQKCRELKIGFTPCPICDSEIKDFPLEDFGQVFGGQEKVLDINIEDPKMVWIKKDFDNYTPYTNVILS